MVEISSPDDLEKWLQDKPIEWGQVIALRCSLRVIPVLNLAIKPPNLPDNQSNQLILAVFRASLISGVIAYSSKLDIRDAADHAARTSADAAHAYSYAVADARGMTRVVYAAHATAHATRASVDTGFSADDAANAIDAATAAIRHTYAASRAFDALNHDVAWLQSNQRVENSSKKLLLEKLWYRRKDSLGKEWELLKSLLLSQSPGWKLWTDWYQAIRDGTLHPGLTRAQQEALYYKIATFPNELWEEGAEAVNQRITELLEEMKEGEGNDLEEEINEPLDLELPPQNKSALQFKANEEGIIELDTEANENELLNDQDAIDRHNEVDFLTNELISSYDPNLPSANAAKPIVTKVQRYIEALGSTPEEANINFIIPRGEVLRQELEQEEKRDEFTNSPPLPDNFKSSLTSLVRAHNLYVLLDPVLDKRDQARLGPDAKEYLVSKEEGLKFVEDAFNEGLVEEEIAGAFNEEAETVHEIPDPDHRQDRRFSESIKNLSRLLLSNTQKIAKKIKENQADIIEVATVGGIGAGGVLLVTNATWTIIGGTLGVGVTCFKGLQWVVKNEEWIIHHFDNKEEVKTFIQNYFSPPQFNHNFPLSIVKPTRDHP